MLSFSPLTLFPAFEKTQTFTYFFPKNEKCSTSFWRILLELLPFLTFGSLTFFPKDEKHFTSFWRILLELIPFLTFSPFFSKGSSFFWRKIYLLSPLKICLIFSLLLVSSEQLPLFR